MDKYTLKCVIECLRQRYQEYASAFCMSVEERERYENKAEAVLSCIQDVRDMLETAENNLRKNP